MLQVRKFLWTWNWDLTHRTNALAGRAWRQHAQRVNAHGMRERRGDRGRGDVGDAGGRDREMRDGGDGGTHLMRRQHLCAVLRGLRAEGTALAAAAMAAPTVGALTRARMHQKWRGSTVFVRIVM